MNTKMTTNSQLSTIESKKQKRTKQNTRTGTESQVWRLEIIWRVMSSEEKEGEWGERCKDQKAYFVGTKQTRGC